MCTLTFFVIVIVIVDISIIVVNIILFTPFSSQVRPGHLGILYNRFGVTGEGGIQETALCREGLNFIVPWFQRPIIFDVRTRPEQIRTQTGSKGIFRLIFRSDL